MGMIGRMSDLLSFTISIAGVLLRHFTTCVGRWIVGVKENVKGV